MIFGLLIEEFSQREGEGHFSKGQKNTYRDNINCERTFLAWERGQVQQVEFVECGHALVWKHIWGAVHPLFPVIYL